MKESQTTESTILVASDDVPVSAPGDPSWLHSARYVVEKKIIVLASGYGVPYSTDHPNWLLHATQGLNKIGIIDDNLMVDVLDFVVFARGLAQGHTFNEEQLHAMRQLLSNLFSSLVTIPPGPYAKY